MKIRYEPSYRLQSGEMQNYIVSKPHIPRDEAIVEWLELKYRSWIVDNIVSSIGDCLFEAITSDPIHINLTFSKPKDGQMFFAQMGGRIVG